MIVFEKKFLKIVQLYELQAELQAVFITVFKRMTDKLVIERLIFK